MDCRITGLLEQGRAGAFSFHEPPLLLVLDLAIVGIDEPPIANPLATILPLPFRRGEGPGEGSVRWCWFMVPMHAGTFVKAVHKSINPKIHQSIPSFHLF